MENPGRRIAERKSQGLSTEARNKETQGETKRKAEAVNEEDVNPRKKQNGRETAVSTGNEAPRDPSEERVRNPKEPQDMETSRMTPQPKERTVQNTVTPQEAGEGQERDREKAPVMARGRGGGR